MCIEDEDRNAVGFDVKTTNNRMELMAVIAGLDALPEESIVTVVSDSQYVIGCATQWWQSWTKAGWPDRIKNKDLVKVMLESIERHKSVAFIHVRGHGKDKVKNEERHKLHSHHNEKADKLAGEQTLLAKEQAA